MKTIKSISVTLLLALTTLSYSFATGSFQLVNFTSLRTAVALTPYEVSINFIYSGNNIPSVSLIGTQLPVGLSLSKIYAEGDNGLHYIKIYGTPASTGNYKLTLLLTDNFGAMLTKEIELNVNKSEYNLNTELPSNLPVGKVGQPYNGKILFPYTGGKPTLNSAEVPYGLFTDTTDIPDTSDESFKKGSLELRIYGTPKKSGTFTMTFVTSDSMYNKTTKNVPIKIEENSVIPEPVTVPVQKTVPAVQGVIDIPKPTETKTVIKTVPLVVKNNTAQSNKETQIVQQASNTEVVVVPATLDEESIQVVTNPIKTEEEKETSFFTSFKSSVKSFLLRLINKI